MSLSETLIKTIQKIDRDISLGVTKNIRQALLVVFEIAKADPLVLWHDKNAALFGKILMLVLVYDLFEDEDELLLAAHLSYFYLRRAKDVAETDQEIIQTNKQLVVLLSQYSDYFRHTVAMCYRGKDQNQGQEGFVRSLGVANVRLPLLEMLVLEEINLITDDYNNDDFLIDRENSVFSSEEIGVEDLDEAKKLDQVILGYIAKKIELKDLSF